MSVPQPRSPKPRSALLVSSLMYKVFLCALYLTTGPALIVLNKELMQGKGFKYPISLSGLGMVAASIFAWGLVWSGAAQLRPESREVLRLSPWLRQCLPVGVCKAATLTFGNAAYLHLNMGFIQMLKAFSPVIVMVVGAVLKVEAPKGGVALSVALLCCGTAVTSWKDPSASGLGVMLFGGAAVTEAVNLVLTQHLLQNKSFTVVEAQCVLAPPGVLFLALSAAVLEWGDMWREGMVLLPLSHPLSFLAAATLGLAINFLTFYVIQATSSLTLKILGMTRNIALVFVGVFQYKEQVPLTEGLGFCVSLLGLCLYNYYKANPVENELLAARLRRLFLGKYEKDGEGSTESQICV